MLSWLQRMLTSSIGKKIVMGGSGVLLIIFLIGHLAGNLTLYADADGKAFDGYAHTLESNPLLPLVEIGLLALFVIHIAMAFRLTLENRDKRSARYVVRATKGRSTVASSTMMITGAVVLVFVVIHLLDFRLSPDKEGPYGLAAMVRERLSTVGGALIYVVGVGVLTLHLTHAVGSALQTFGIRHPKYEAVLRIASRGLAVLLGLGFLSFPIIVFATGGGRG